MTKTQIANFYQVRPAYVDPTSAVRPNLNLSIYPVLLIERVVAELIYLQSNIASIPREGDQARLQGVIGDWDRFNK